MIDTVATGGPAATGALGAGLAAVRASRLVQNFGWYVAGELCVRVSRLVTTVLLARVLLPADFGIAAMALTAYELIRVLANYGAAAFLVRSTDAAFPAAAVMINRLAYVVAIGLVVLQVMAGAVIAHVAGRPDLFAMLGVLALAHLAIPLTEVCYARLQRDNRLKALAGVMSAQVLADNALSVALALAGYGAWAIVLPKLLTVPLYVVLLWRASPEALPTADTPARIATFAPFAWPYLGAEVLAALRLHLDKVLVGSLLGVEALGVYAFAFNAGLGISMAMTAALSASLFPHLSETQRHRGDLVAAFDRAVLRMVAPVAVLIALQALAALVYVPIVFGERWTFAAPYVALICLSGVLRPLYDASCQLLRARGDTHLELRGALALTLVVLGAFTLALLAGAGIGPALVALAIASLAGHGAFAVWARARCRCAR